MVIDNSSLEKFTTCPQSAWNYMVMGREAHAKSAALTFGGALHKGLERLLKGEPEQNQNLAILHFFAENPTPVDEYRTVDTCLEVLKHYRVRETFPDYAWELAKDDQGPIIERAFELPFAVFDVDCPISFMENGVWVTKDVGKLHVAWSGRIDVIAHCNGKRRVVDHKTTSIAGDQTIQEFQLSSQTLGYAWAANQLYPDNPVDGTCINFIHLKKPAKGLGLMDRGPRGGEPALNFFRSYFDYTQWRVDWWKEQTQLALEEWIHTLMTGKPRSATKWCFHKYGKCPYHDVCSVDNSDLQKRLLLSDMYRDVTWNPTHE